MSHYYILYLIVSIHYKPVAITLNRIFIVIANIMLLASVYKKLITLTGLLTTADALEATAAITAGLIISFDVSSVWSPS